MKKKLLKHVTFNQGWVHQTRHQTKNYIIFTKNTYEIQERDILTCMGAKDFAYTESMKINE